MAGRSLSPTQVAHPQAAPSAAVPTQASVQIPVDVSQIYFELWLFRINLTLQDLSYYEVQQILAKNYQLKPVHDKTAAVKYLVFNHDQWISYDDKDTFKQKIDWANDIGFGGSLIWASDLGTLQIPREKVRDTPLIFYCNR